MAGVSIGLLAKACSVKIQTITISSRNPDPVREPYYHLMAFQESAARHGIVPHFLNEGPYCGLMSKPKHLRQYLEREGGSFGKVLVVDAWDVVFTTGIEEIEYNAKSISENIIFNSESNCFPDGSLSGPFDRLAGENHKYRYLNSGFIFGDTDAVLQMLRDMNLDDIPNDRRRADGSWENFNDQKYYQLYALQTLGKTALDYRGILCQTLHGAADDEFAFLPDTMRVVSLLTKNQPCVIHGNGSGKDWLKRIIGWLNL